MAEENLRLETKKGLRWSALGNISTQLIRFGFGLILARLLSPDAYGVVGMLTVFICLVGVFIDCGFSQALITKHNRTQIDFSTEFWFNVLVGIGGYLVLYAISPLVADFYKMPELSLILKVVGLGVIINSFCVVQSAQLSIRLDFKTPATINVVSQLISSVIGIILAYYGWGVWALVCQQMSGLFLFAVGLWWKVRWKPSFIFSIESFRYLWGYGSKVLGSSLLSQLYDNIQPLIIGKAFNSRTLGLYTRAQAFAILPTSNVSGILGKVTFPILSKVNNDPARMVDIYRRMIRTSGFFVFPIMIFLAGVADPLVKVLLNEQWYDSIPLLVIVSFSLMWQPVSYVNINLLNAAKHPEIVLKLEMIKKPLGLIILLISSRLGIIEFALGNLFVCLFAVVVNTYFTGKCFGVSFVSLIKDLSLPFFSSLLMGAGVYLTTTIILNPLVSLVVSSVLGIIMYYLLSKMLMNDLMTDSLSLIKRK